MKWMEALKEWNKTQPKWSIPKKGTANYIAVKKMLGDESVAKKPAKKTKPKPKTKPAKKSKPAPIETFEELFEEVAPVKRKVGRPRKS